MKTAMLKVLPCAIIALMIPAAFAQQGAASSTSPQNRYQSLYNANAKPVRLAEAKTPSAQPAVKPMTAAEFHTWLKNVKAKRQMISQAKKKAHVAQKATSTTSAASAAAISYEEGQKVMLKSVPKSSIHSPENADSQEAFRSMLLQNMPLSPSQVVKLRQQVDLAQRASAIPANIPPKPVSSTIMVNLAPGATPPAVRLAKGYVSSLVFVDSTGTPWPIAAFDIGNPKSVNIQWDGRSNIILMQAVSPYAFGDIVVRLVGLPTPITLELISGQRSVDYRVDLHVSGIGPNTKELPVGTDMPNGASQLLLGVLDGVAPAGSRQLKVAGRSKAWLLGERIYLRTRFTVLSPGWIGKMTSPDGMQAYELPKTSTVLISRYGDPVQLKIEGL